MSVEFIVLLFLILFGGGLLLWLNFITWSTIRTTQTIVDQNEGNLSIINEHFSTMIDTITKIDVNLISDKSAYASLNSLVLKTMSYIIAENKEMASSTMIEYGLLLQQTIHNQMIDLKMGSKEDQDSDDSDESEDYDIGDILN